MRELSLNVMDIAQNAIRAGAALTQIRVLDDRAADAFTIEIEDNGCGMTAEQVQNVIDPFFTTRTTRKVGLGVPLFKMEAEMTGGGLTIESEVGKGTLVRAVFHPSHVDMVPPGDIAGIVHLLITCNPELDFVYEKRLVPAAGAAAGFCLDTRELKAQLGDVPLSTPEVSTWILEYLGELEASLGNLENNAPDDSGEKGTSL